MFKKGDVVECINSEYSEGSLAKGGTYVVEQLTEAGILWLYGVRGGWSVDRFRLVRDLSDGPYYKIVHERQCDCDLDVLMSKGCLCGGK